MNSIIIDLTPNRHFCNLKIKCISKHLNSIGLEKVENDKNTFNKYINKCKGEKLFISENGELSFEFLNYEFNQKFINSMIERCREVLNNLQLDYKSKLSDDTFFIYWPDSIDITKVKGLHNLSNDYIIKTYEILDNVYSSIVQKKILN